MASLLELDTYDPNRFLDKIIEHLRLRNDAALARRLGIAPPAISNIRRKVHPIGATLLLNIHEETGWEISALRKLMGDKRRSFCASN